MQVSDMVLRPGRSVVVLLCAVLALATAASLSRETEDLCWLGESSYRVGQTWHPVMLPSGQSKCVNCTCYKGGRTQCDKMECQRPACDEPKIVPGECCPVCDHFDNLPPTAGREGETEREKDAAGCVYDGRQLKHEERFPSNTTGLRPTRRHQCVLCACSNGQVLCQLKSCLPSKCTKFKTVPTDCCPVCADQGFQTEDHVPVVMSDPKQDNRTEADCSTPMGLHPNGSSWNPEIGSFGIVKCITCTCLSGVVNCTRKKCTPDENGLPCHGAEGSCCKECMPKTSGRKAGDELTSESRPGGHKSRPTGNNSRGEKRRPEGKKKAETCRGKKCRQRKSEKDKQNGKDRRPKCGQSDGRKKAVSPDRKSNLTRLSDVIDRLCLPRHTDRLVYRVKGDNFQLLAFDLVAGSSVEVLRWAFVDGVQQDTERQTLVADDFRKNVTCSHIVGATEKRGFKKLLKKVDSKMKKCVKQTPRCATKFLDGLSTRERRIKPIAVHNVCGA